ncbi:MAG: hypothetical protein GY930_00800 [bacterium]|nr:hypothetical protein [bacterium]
MADWNLHYQELREQLALREKNKGRLHRARVELDAQLTELDKHKVRLEKERKDVAKLEGLSLTALFHTILCSKTEQLDIERQEALRAKLKFDQCRGAVARRKEEVGELVAKIEAGEGLETEVAAVLKQKEEWLTREGGEHAQQLADFAENIANAKSHQRELGEAWAAGDEACESMEKVVKSLQTAKSWGTYDMLGGGIVATSVKHSHINKAKGYMEDAVYKLETYSDELQDVNLEWNSSMGISSFNTFADYLLDGLIFDWVVQSKIKKSLGSCTRAVSSVKSIQRRLETEIAEVKDRVRTLEAERIELLEQG